MPREIVVPREPPKEERESMPEFERVFGRMEERIEELTRELKRLGEEKHTCTGDSCHVLADREKDFEARIEALSIQVAQLSQKPREPSTVPCDNCGASLQVPAELGPGDKVSCSECKHSLMLAE